MLVPPRVYLFVVVTLSRSTEVVTKQVNLDVLTPGETARGLSQVDSAQKRAPPVEEPRA